MTSPIAFGIRLCLHFPAAITHKDCLVFLPSSLQPQTADDPASDCRLASHRAADDLVPDDHTEKGQNEKSENLTRVEVYQHEECEPSGEELPPGRFFHDADVITRPP